MENTENPHTEHLTPRPKRKGQGKGLLILRFSAIGDVAMTVPVVKALADARPDISITMVSRPYAKAFYEGIAPNVTFVGIDLKDKRYKGLLGMEHLYKDLSRYQPDMVADLHDVLRTKYVRWRFKGAGIPVEYIDKNREGRRALTRKENKIREQQPTSFEKYQAVFHRLGIDFKLHAEEVPMADIITPTRMDGKDSSSWGEWERAIGIAPFAAHNGKIYPLEKMERVIADLTAAHPDLSILLFGGGKQETEVFGKWVSKYNKVIYASGKCNGMREELAVMKQLRCMITMDSGNMHLASLVGTPVVSVWGATHPLAGFMGWGQDPENAVQVDMPCRPCSIYGNKPCMRDDYACLNNITPEMIIGRVEKYL